MKVLKWKFSGETGIPATRYWIEVQIGDAVYSHSGLHMVNSEEALKAVAVSQIADIVRKEILMELENR